MSERLRLTHADITRNESGIGNHALEETHAIRARRVRLFAAGQEGALQAM